MNLISTSFDSTTLSRALASAAEFHCRTLTRLPFLDADAIDQLSIQLHILVVDPADLSHFSDADQKEFAAEIGRINSRIKTVVVIGPASHPGAVSSGALRQWIESSNAVVIDGSSWPSYLNRVPAVQAQLKYLTGCPYSKEFLVLLADQLKQLVQFHRHRQKKLWIFDLDQTLWGGILAEVGASGLDLNSDSAEGRARLDLQKEILQARARGKILAVCSRNELSEVKEAFHALSAMVLKLDDFAMISANWKSKDIQIAEICQQLRILPGDAEFFDDDPHERDLVKSAQPDISVADFPASVFERPLFVRRLLGPTNPFATKEDALRGKSYEANLARQSVRQSASDQSQWLESLGAVLSVEEVGSTHEDRVTQLFGKTNQFNFNPQSYSRSSTTAYAIRYVDRLGDDGIIAAIRFECSGDVLKVSDFILSCRAFGRGIEDRLLEWLLAKNCNARFLAVLYKDTGRNRAATDFATRIGLEKRSGSFDLEWFGSVETLTFRKGLPLAVKDDHV